MRKKTRNKQARGFRVGKPVSLAVAFTAGALLTTSMASWASFQYVGKPVGVESAGSAASSIYLPGPGAAPEKPDLQGYQRAFTHTPALIEKGAGIAWPCHGSGQGTLSKVLYRLLPPGWTLYTKPGTLLDILTYYDCHSSPWTVPLRQVLHREGYTGTLWWGYNVLSISPRPALTATATPVPSVPPVIQPGGPMIPANSTPAMVQTTDPLPKPAIIQADPLPKVGVDPKPAVQNPIAACHRMKIPAVEHPAAIVPPATVPPAQALPLTLGPDGKLIQTGWHTRVINLDKAVHGGWKLAIPRHPNERQIQLARAWLRNGGSLYYPLPQGQGK